MAVVSAGFSPDLKGPEHHVLVSLGEVSEKLGFVFLTGELDELVFLPLELLAHGDLVL